MPIQHPGTYRSSRREGPLFKGMNMTFSPNSGNWRLSAFPLRSSHAVQPSGPRLPRLTEVAAQLTNHVKAGWSLAILPKCFRREPANTLTFAFTSRTPRSPLLLAGESATAVPSGTTSTPYCEVSSLETSARNARIAGSLSVRNNTRRCPAHEILAATAGATQGWPTPLLGKAMP